MRMSSGLALCGVLMIGSAGLVGGEARPQAGVEAVGEPVNGVRSRLAAEGKSFRAGHPIPMSFEVQNVGKEETNFGQHSITASGGLMVIDAEGKEVPFLGGPAGVMVRPTPIGPGQKVVVESFDLERWFYLRKPGKYAVLVRENRTYPATGKLEFEVTPDPKGTADGDPVGRLLPLTKGKEKWVLVTPARAEERVRPGKNRKEVPGRAVIFQGPDAKRDGKIVWFWLTEEPAAEEPAAPRSAWPPDTSEIGKVGRWHVYVHAPRAALEEWPTVLEEVKGALGTERP